MDSFKGQIHGGIYDINFGAFGAEFASGAFQARLHFYLPGRGRLCITVKAESEWQDFGGYYRASNATLYLMSEPVLLDQFIEELRLVSKGAGSIATLEGVVYEVRVEQRCSS